MASLINRAVIEMWKKAQFPVDKKNGELSGKDGIWFSVVTITKKSALPVSGAIDYTIDNQGSSKVYLFDGAVVIDPGTSWSPTKSTSLPFINEPILTFQDDPQLTRVFTPVTPATE